MEIIDPAKAEMIIRTDVILTWLPRRTTITSATTSFAPEEIPSTKGPAIGLWKKV